MSSQYHLYELEVAQNRSHPAHILPQPSAPSERVLDIGCGAGQTLIAAYPDRISFGIDIDIEALKLGSSLTTEVVFTYGSNSARPHVKNSAVVREDPSFRASALDGSLSRKPRYSYMAERYAKPPDRIARPHMGATPLAHM